MRFKSKKKSGKKKNSVSRGANQSTLTREVWGLLLFAVAVMIAVALISYHPHDPIWKLSDANVYAVRNYLGIAGATFAFYVFQWTFGYAAMVFPLILLVYSFALLARNEFRRYLRTVALLLSWAYFIAILLAMPAAFRTLGHPMEYYPSGFIGGITAQYLVKLFGRFASGFLVIVGFLLLLVVSFRFPFSAIPLGIYEFTTRALQGIGQGIQRLTAALFAVRNRPRRVSGERTARHGDDAPAPLPPVEIASEAIIEEPPAVSEPEIITQRASEQMQSGKNENIPPLGGKGGLAANSGSENAGEVLPGPEGGIEIEEAVQEKELDYDTLVRNSLEKYQFPSTEMLRDDPNEIRIPREELAANAQLLERTLGQFGVKARVKRVVEGPVITLYALQPAEGVKINQIVSLADDLALALRAKAIRMIAPIPGEAAIGIEIPNKKPSTVYFKSIVRSEKFINAASPLVLGLGKTISGEVFCADLTQLPHLLMAGTTGSGKSVGINSMIASILYRVPPSDVKFVMIDPKKLELSLYAKLKDHYLAICPDLDEIVITHPQNAILILRSVVNEMEERYDKLAAFGVRDIISYNQKIEKYRDAGERSDKYRRLPYIIVVIDELADLILTASREVEEPITRLAQMARAVGIHLIVATQRPSVDILTGLIKANFPARVAYQVATRPDSKVIMDMYGAEKLIGKGDMLFLPAGTGKPIRLQSPLISTEEVDHIIKHVRKQPKFPPYELKLIRTRTSTGPGSVKAFEQDELFEQAREIVIRHQQGSISLLQRKLKIGYARAARLIDELEEEGVVGPGRGSKARDVLISALGDEIDKERS